jgi:hypothetical protein
LFVSSLRLTCRERCIRQNRIDFRDQLVRFHLIAAYDLQRFKNAGGLSADIDKLEGLHDARCHDRAFYIAAYDGSSGVEDLGFTKRPVIPESTRNGDEECANQPL